MTVNKAGPNESVALRLTRRMWDRRAATWHRHGAAGLERVVDAVLREAGDPGAQVVVDLGCGTGQLTLPLAACGASVTGVDLSPQMIRLLEDKAHRAGLDSVATLTQAIELVTFPEESVDLVVSNYALHHLRDRDKAAVVRAAVTWLRPGGRLIVGDMMFGFGRTSRDRQIIRSKAAIMLRRGPAGWLRLAKNAVRLSLRLGERPAPPGTWLRYFRSAGLEEVAIVPVVTEAALVVGRKP